MCNKTKKFAKSIYAKSLGQYLGWQRVRLFILIKLKESLRREEKIKKPLISLGWFSGGPLYFHDRLIMLKPTMAFSS